MTKDSIVIGLAGNPNTGKSTVFNSLTGLKQHTGNWPGKTVTNAQGTFTHKNVDYTLVDLPGTYSLMANSLDEEIARDFIISDLPQVTVIVADGTSLERNLNLALQILDITDNVVLCVNLMDEAHRKNIEIDLIKLEKILGVPVVGTSAQKKIGLEDLKNVIEDLVDGTIRTNPLRLNIEDRDLDHDEKVAVIVRKSESIHDEVVRYGNKEYNSTDRKIDKILTSKSFGIPIMLLLLGVIFWITIVGANYPSEMLAKGLFYIEDRLSDLFIFLSIPMWIHDIFLLGIYRTLAWVVSVMLPPMAIFFPLFTFMEDLGYLPRIAFNLDRYFKKACAHGKQALTMCMGFGCNAAGVISCRIIDSPREKLIAIITNNFVPCNGRFPTLIILATIFFASYKGFLSSVIIAITLLLSILLGVGLTLFISKLLSKTLLKGLPSSFTLELPPYRKPQAGRIIVRSIFDRTIFVLARAVGVAAPAGLLIWLMANLGLGDMSLLNHVAGFLDPFARLIGLDGFILMAFILGLPANEIVIPILIMSYLSRGAMLELDIPSMGQLFIDNGWTPITAICMIIFSINHWPCATTLWTIKKETNSLKWTFASFIIPTITGLVLCFLVAQGARIFL